MLLESGTIILSGTSEAAGSIGVYVGMGGVSDVVGTGGRVGTTNVGTSSLLSIASGRISFMNGLTGPCLTLDTACSSTLVTVHLAVSGLMVAECPLALSTGVGYLDEATNVSFSAAGMLSVHGRCHTFDGRADGYCRGESMTTALLDAVAGGAVIRGILV